MGKIIGVPIGDIDKSGLLFFQILHRIVMGESIQPNRSPGAGYLLLKFVQKDLPIAQRFSRRLSEPGIDRNTTPLFIQDPREDIPGGKRRHLTLKTWLPVDKLQDRGVGVRNFLVAVHPVVIRKSSQDLVITGVGEAVTVGNIGLATQQAIPVDLPLGSDHLPEERHQKLASRLRRLPPPGVGKSLSVSSVIAMGKEQ